MKIELTEIDRDSLKVGDVVGVARKIQCGWHWFRHDKIIPAKIVKITPKRTKIVTDKFGEHDKYEKFYELNEDAAQETILAEAFKTLQDGIYELGELRRNDPEMKLAHPERSHPDPDRLLSPAERAASVRH